MDESEPPPGVVQRLLDRFVRFNPALCNPEWQGMSLTVRLRPPILEGLSRLAVFIVKEAAAPRLRAIGKPILVAVGSQNNLNSARSALQRRDDFELVTFHNLRIEGCARISMLGQYLTGLWILALLPLLLIVERRQHVRRAMLARTDALVITMGWGFGIRRFLTRTNPRAVVFMSALSSYHCLIIEQARKAGLPTVFLTHAPIGRGQVELPTDHALLDGEFQKTLFPTSATRFAVTGSGRGKELAAAARDRSSAAGVLIATNTLIRDLHEVEHLIRQLRERHGEIPCVIRPHPADRGRFEVHRELARRTGARYQDPSNPLWFDADDCKFLVSTQSGVILDALLLGFFPLIIRSPATDRVLMHGPDDYYGFAELDLAREIDLADPSLPLAWDAGRNLELLEKSADPTWDTYAAIEREFDSILAQEGDRRERHEG